MAKLALTMFLTLAAGTALAQNQVGITKDIPSVTVQTESGPVERGGSGNLHRGYEWSFRLNAA